MEESFFLCNWCMDQYNLENKIPKMLAECGHTICLECLKKNIQNKQELQCYIDQKLINLKDKTTDNFPNNYALISYLKQIQQKSDVVPKNIRERSSEKLDRMTKSSHKDVVLSERKYQKNENSKFLSNSDLQSSLNQITNKKLCKDHQKELEIMCVECKQWVCYKCGLFGKHKNHEFINGDEIKQESVEFCNDLVKLNQKLRKIDEKMKDQIFENILKTQKKNFQAKTQAKLQKYYDLALKRLKEKKKYIQNKINQLDKQFVESLDHTVEKEIHVQFEKSLPFQQKLDEIIKQIGDTQLPNEKIYMNLKKKNPQIKISIEEFLNENQNTINKFEEVIKKFYSEIKIEFDAESSFGLTLKQSKLQQNQMTNQRSLDLIIHNSKQNFKEDANLLESIKLEDSEFNSINKYSLSNSRIQPNPPIDSHHLRKSIDDRKNQFKNNSQQTISKSKSKPSQKINQQNKPILQSSRDKKLRFSKKKFQYERNKGIYQSKEKQIPFSLQRNYSRKKSDIGDAFKPQRKSLRVRDISSQKKLKLTEQTKNEILDLTNLKLNDNFLVSLNVILNNNKKIKKIVLKDNYFTDIGVQKLCEILSGYSNIETIDLSGNILSKKVFQLLSKLAQKNQNLKEVILVNCQFQQSDFQSYLKDFGNTKITINQINQQTLISSQFVIVQILFQN